MPTIKDDAVCIRHWDFSETSQTVSLLTRDHGIVRGLAKGAKRPRGSFSGGIDVLSCGQVVFSVKPGRDLSTIMQWDLQRVFPVIRRDLQANRAAWYMVDLVHHMLTDQDPHPAVYGSLCAALESLEQIDRIEATLMGFQWMLLRETGYQPQLDHDAETGGPLPEDGATLAFSASAGGVVADTGDPGRWRVRRPTIEALRAVARNGSPANATARTIHRANRLMAAYLRDLIGSEPPSMAWLYPDLETPRQLDRHL